MTTAFRIGHGFDVHRTQVGRPLILGGVLIPCAFGLEGHSDADVLTHALADAILGAVGLPDIGYWFPNTDPALEGIDSQKILARAVAEARKLGWAPGNVDTTLVAERPKIAPHLEAIRGQLARTCGIAVDAVGVKATTNEQIGSVGRGEGMTAFAVALMVRCER